VVEEVDYMRPARTLPKAEVQNRTAAQMQPEKPLLPHATH
jgi:hypothetical protein